MGALRAQAVAAWNALCEGHRSQTELKAFTWTLGSLLFLFPFGIVFVGFQTLPESFSWTSSVIIALSALVTALSEARAVGSTRAMIGLIVLSLLLFSIEYLGVTTGVPFGRYTYTSSLGGAVAGVPAAIAFAWYSTVVNAWRISRGLSAARRASWLLVPASAAILTLSLDLALEPMASRVTRYWLWEQESIPLQNYASWMVFAFVASLALSWLYDPRVRQERSVSLTSGLVLGMQFVLFLATDIVQGFPLSALLALAVLALPPLAFRYVGTRPAPGKEVA